MWVFVSLVKLKSNKLSSYMDELQVMSHRKEPNHSINNFISLTFSLSVLLPSVSDSAPEEVGL